MMIKRFVIGKGPLMQHMSAMVVVTPTIPIAAFVRAGGTIFPPLGVNVACPFSTRNRSILRRRPSGEGATARYIERG
jgi:hypothetical protein